nr:hypothetical protein [uncultured Romboutsia sp.]
MQLQENDIKELINIIDWALMNGYGGLDEPIYATEILEKLVTEIDANKESDNYFKETYEF